MDVTKENAKTTLIITLSDTEFNMFKTMLEYVAEGNTGLSCSVDDFAKDLFDKVK